MFLFYFIEHRQWSELLEIVEQAFRDNGIGVTSFKRDKVMPCAPSSPPALATAPLATLPARRDWSNLVDTALSVWTSFWGNTESRVQYFVFPPPGSSWFRMVFEGS